jgi:hypothetical protein
MPINTLSPRARFQSNHQRAGAHQDIVMAPNFKDACEITLAEYARQLTCDSQLEACAVGYKLQGAKDALNILLNLGDLKAPDYTATPEQLQPV